MGVKRFFGVWSVFLSRNLQSKMAYKADFIIGVLANILMQLLGYLAIWVIFSQTDELDGWQYYEVLFMYGMAAACSGCSEFFLDGVWSIGGQFIRKGELDRLLTRPMNPLMSILMSKLEPHGLGQIIFGFVVMGSALMHGQMKPLQGGIWLLPLLVICGALIYLAINLFVASLAFFATRVMGMQVMIHHLNSFCRYPITLYPKTIQIMISWLIPFAFTSFYPASLILNKEAVKLGYLTPVMTVGLLFFSYRFWLWGLKHYQSAGG